MLLESMKRVRDDMEVQEKAFDDKLECQNTETVGREKEIYDVIGNVKTEIGQVDKKLDSNKVKGDFKIGILLKKLRTET